MGSPGNVSNRLPGCETVIVICENPLAFGSFASYESEHEANQHSFHVIP